MLLQQEDSAALRGGLMLWPTTWKLLVQMGQAHRCMMETDQRNARE